MRPHRRLILWFSIAFFIAFAGMRLILWGMPQVIMSAATSRLTNVAGVNVLYHAPPPTHENTTVVRPSPDLAYSICVYDLSNGPVEVVAHFPRDTYWSISAYGDDTSNFFVANDQEHSSPARFVFAGSADPGQIHSPSMKGVILLRHHLASPEELIEADTARNRGHCGPVEE